MEFKRQTLLVIDADGAFCEVIRILLAGQYRVLLANDGASGIHLAQAERPELLVLDLILPGMSGVEVCRALKSFAETCAIPILILTASSDDELRANALKAGADALISKPLGPRELAIRVRNLLEKNAGGGASNPWEPERFSEPVLSCGNLTLDFNGMETVVDCVPVKMTVLEMNLLALFVRNVGTIFSRRQILDLVWKEREVLDRVVDNHVLQLRRKLEGFDHEIVSVYGGGYGIRTKQDHRSPALLS